MYEDMIATLSNVPGLRSISAVTIISSAYIPFGVTVGFGKSKICELQCHTLVFFCAVKGAAVAGV